MEVMIDKPEKIMVEKHSSSTRMIVGADKGIELKNLPRIPENAFVISVDPLYFLQIGEGKLLITDGIYWLDENPREVCRKSFCFGKNEKGWFLNIGVPTMILDRWLYRIRLEKDVLKNGIAVYPHELNENEVFKTNRRTIIVRNECTDKNNYPIQCIEERNLKMVKIDYANGTYYVPRLFVKQKWGVEI